MKSKAVEGKESLKEIMKKPGAKRTYHFVACNAGGYEVFADYVVPSAILAPKTGRLYGGYGGRIYLGWFPVPE